MNDDRLLSHGQTSQMSRLSSYSGRHFDFLDTHHSVFSRSSYYNDMLLIHPWSRRPCSRTSGIALTTLRSKSCSPRLHELSRPKIKREQHIRQEIFDNVTNYAYSGVTVAALNAQPSDRVIKLAAPKKISDGYIEAIILPTIVPKSATQGRTTERVSSLAKPQNNVLLLRAAWKKQYKIKS